MKKLSLALMLVFAFAFSQAQKIEVSKGSVTVDGQPCLTVDKSDLNNLAIKDLSGNDIVYLKFLRDPLNQLYNVVVFVNSKKSFTSKRFIYNVKTLVKRMIDDKLLVNCIIDETKVDNFVMKHGE
ncbi:MAG TPA: hypothetical protein VG603_09850 [Chitinophagales bacterium]|nr:hypothetical protein [Chitinophagales bacterium]